MLITLKIYPVPTLKKVIFTILLLNCCIILGQQKVVVIDPGHGGNDSGAIGINKIQEKEVVLKIANEILRLNKLLLANELDIYLTRYDDTLVSLSNRVQLAKSLKVDAFVSLHCNHSDNINARGVEVYVYNQNSEFSDDATWLAFQLQSDLNKKLGFESRGVKFTNFQVLRETIDYMPSVLVELGFLSNWDESNYYLEPNNTQVMALLILMGLRNFLNTSK